MNSSQPVATASSTPPSGDDDTSRNIGLAPTMGPPSSSGVVLALVVGAVASAVVVYFYLARVRWPRERKETTLEEKEAKFDRERALQAEFPNA